MNETLHNEIKRVEELLKFYEEIPEGVFGAVMIKESLKKAKNAISKKDIEYAIEDLQNITG